MAIQSVMWSMFRKSIEVSGVRPNISMRMPHQPHPLACRRALASEAADFAATLALRLCDLVKARRLPPASALWRYGVDNLLVRAVDSHPQASNAWEDRRSGVCAWIGSAGVGLAG